VVVVVVVLLLLDRLTIFLRVRVPVIHPFRAESILLEYEHVRAPYRLVRGI